MLGLRATFTVGLAALACLLTPASAEFSAKATELEALRNQATGNIIPIDNKQFGKYVSPKKRDYDVFLYLTATAPTYQCVVCGPAGEHFELVVSNYYYQHGTPLTKTRPIFFLSVDYGPNVQATFSKLGVSNVPLVWFYGENGAPGVSDKFDDLFRKGVSHEYFRNAIVQKTGEDFKVSIPINWGNLIIMSTMWIGIAIALYLFFPVAFALRYAHYVFCLGCMGACLLFTSGYMWNVIRGAGAYTRGRDGKMTIWGGGGQQTMSESYIVILCNGVAAIGFILMMLSPKIKWVSPTVSTVLFLVMAAGLMSTEIYLYREHKNGGYPFRLFF